MKASIWGVDFSGTRNKDTPPGSENVHMLSTLEPGADGQDLDYLDP